MVYFYHKGVISLDVLKKIRISIRKVHRFLNPFESEYDKYMDDFHQRNIERDGFDVMDDFMNNLPFSHTLDRYKEWMNKDEEEE